MRPAETDAARTGPGAAAAAKRTRVARSEDNSRRTLSARGTCMKKTVVLTALLAGMCASAFASGKVGADFGVSPFMFFTDNNEADPAWDLDGNLFVGYDFSELGIPIGIQGNVGLLRLSEKASDSGDSMTAVQNNVELGLLIYVPIALAPSLYISPEFGFSHQIMTSAKISTSGVSVSYTRKTAKDTGTDPNTFDFNSIKLGVGFERGINDNFFI
jgi:hypothetical protein